MARRLRRPLGLALAAIGVVALVWTLCVWQWGDPLTGTYTAFRQRQLADEYAGLVRAGAPRGPTQTALAARRARVRARPGDPVARMRIDRIDLDVIVVEGTDAQSLESGPGRDRRSFLPGEGELVYIAGHRTTYGAPFANLDGLRRGDRISLETAYGRFVYVVTTHRVVAADDLSVLRSPGREMLRLQTCHPRFFASRRYVVSAMAVDVTRNTGAAASRV